MDESEERIIMREKVLIVDDIELNREILAVALGDQYDIAGSGWREDNRDSEE